MNEFLRNVWCLQGIPIDALAYGQAIEAVQSAIQERRRCFLSTPNLNFIIQARKSVPFQNSVIDSNLVLIDGMPPLWVARLLGIPGIEKVSGSDLVESLWHHSPPGGKKIRVFLFGGEAGIGESACKRINEKSSGLECVGYVNPGFGTVEEMSEAKLIQQINESQADFVIVSLGAKKGQAWIMANKDRLDAPVISHLGAVINFAAGNISRAPRWMQRVGMEWLWRIGQEPALWRRYFFDGIDFLGLLITRAGPNFLWRLTHRAMLKTSDPVEFRLEKEGDTTVVRLNGACLISTIAPLRQLFEQLSRANSEVLLDMSDVPVIDGAFLGLCLLLRKYLEKQQGRLVFRGLNPALARLFRWNAVEFML